MTDRNNKFQTRTRKPDLNTLVYGKVPPQAIDLEEAVLGACMIEKDTFNDVISILPNGDFFYNDAHQRIYSAMMRLQAVGSPVDLLTITDELRKSSELDMVGGAYYLSRLTMSVISSAHVEAHAYIVREKYMSREMIRISGGIINDAYEDSTDVFDLMASAERSFTDLSVSNVGGGAKSAAELALDAATNLDQLQKSNLTISGIPTGFPSLDIRTSGWQKTDLIIIAARPSVGKTAFALNLALNAALNPGRRYAVAIFSLEMGRLPVTNRILSSMSEVELYKFSIPRGIKRQDDAESVRHASNEFSKLKLYIDDTAGLSTFELRARARRLKKKFGIEMILIDYLQLMSGDPKSKNRQEEISTISRDLKALAKDLDVPIIALSQLNRGIEKNGVANKVPQLSDLRESGAIEQDADMVIFLTRPDYQKSKDEVDPMVENCAEVHIAKYRNGASGVTISMNFKKDIQLWSDPVEFDDFPAPDNPHAGIGEFGGSKLFTPQGFQRNTRDITESNKIEPDAPF